MPTDRTQQAPSDTSNFLFPAEWHAIAAVCDDAHTGLLFMRNGIITRVNNVLAELLGVDAAQLVGRPVAAILAGAGPDISIANWNPAHPATSGQTVCLTGRDGHPIEFDVTASQFDNMSDAAGTAWILHPAAHMGGGSSHMFQAQEIIDLLPDPVLICAGDSTIRYASPAFSRLHGGPDNGLDQSRLLDLAHPEDRSRLEQTFGALAGSVEATLALRLRGQDGRWRQYTGHARALGRGDAGAVLVALHDVTEQAQELQGAAADRKRQLHYLNRLLRLAQQPHPQADSALKVILKAAAKALGAHRCGYWETGPEPSASHCVMAYDEVRQNLVTEASEATEAAGAMNAQGTDALHPLLRQVLNDGQALVVTDVDQDPRTALACEYFHAASVKAVMIVPVRGAGEGAGLLMLSQLQTPRAWRKDEAEFAIQCAGLIALVFEEAARAREKTQPHRHAHQDSLTGLPNRQFLFERAADIFPRMAANSTSLAAFFIDLDGLKHVNDALGHAIGDELLKAVALRLKNIVRKDDVLARLGGDEFMLLAQNLNDMRIAEDIAQQVVDAMNAPFSLRGHELQVSVSVGIALYPFDGGDIDTLMKKADIALYHAKSGGRNRYQMFSPRQSGRVSKQSVLEGELRRAIRERELQHYYQPQIDLRTGKVRCVEALLRWHHPRQGLLLPAAFLPLAERSGLIQTISKWVMNDACDQLAAWHDKGLERFNIAINLAAGQLADNNLASVLEEALDRTGVTPAQLEWEVQENTVMQHEAMDTSLLDRMVEMQVALSIDDFGTGYSNLGYLRRYPVRKVKIDRSLIHSLPDEGDGRAITDAIIMMAQPLGLDVVAEGVETPQQMEYLRARGCHIAQGFYFTQPLTADQFETWLIRH